MAIRKNRPKKHIKESYIHAGLLYTGEEKEYISVD